ncbi:DUF7019 family protein [Promicromonospora sp. NPDC060271]|uniref:DUF7019 family protein n=1 Tax=Promicromonospora sp. NPDC060271 TaxID=3347089 RepID=UPI00365FDA63
MSTSYYLYISDSKVDMLLQQIDPGSTRSHQTELSIGLKMFGGRQTSVAAQGSDQIARLERVVRHLSDTRSVGSLDAPESFFWGLMPMRWRVIQTEFGGPLAFFGGTWEGKSVGLGGSGRHLLAPGAPESGFGMGSMMPALLDGIAASSELEDELVVDAVEDEIDGDLGALETVRKAVAGLRGPTQNVEFVAKRLLHGEAGGPDAPHPVLLGTPLYVALVD